MKRTLLLIFIGLSFAAEAQSYSSYDIFECFRDDTLHPRKIAEVKLDDGRIVYEHNIGYNHHVLLNPAPDYIFLLDNREFPEEYYNVYTDTLLTKQIYIDGERLDKDTTDSCMTLYCYDKHNRLIKQQKYCQSYPNGHKWEKDPSRETTYEYGPAKSYTKYEYGVEGTSKKKENLFFTKYKYNTNGKISSEKGYGTGKIDNPNNRDTGIINFDGEKYKYALFANTVYHYYDSKYVRIESLDGKIFVVDSFFFDKRNLLTRRVKKSYDMHSTTEEKYYYNEQHNLIKVIAESDGAQKRTQLYKYYK